MFKRSCLMAALSSTLLVSSPLLAQSTERTNPGFTYLQLGLSALNFDDDIVVMNQTGSFSQTGASYSGAAGVNLAGSLEVSEGYFLKFDTSYVTNDGYNTEINISETLIGAGGYTPLTSNKDTYFIGKGFLYISNAEVCNNVTCKDEDNNGAGFEASLKHHFTPRFALEGGIQYLSKDYDSGTVLLLGLHAGGQGHGFYSQFKLYDDATLTNIAYRYTF